MKDKQYQLSFGEGDKSLTAGLRLAQVEVIAQRIIYRRLRPIGMTPEQTIILLEIRNSSNHITPARLGKILRRDAPAISRVLKRMQKNGVIRLVNDLEYKHMIRAEITEKGVEVCKAVEELVTNKEYNAFVGLSEPELDAFLSTLDKVEDSAFRILKRIKAGLD